MVGEVKAIAGNAREATNDLGTLRAEVDASLRKGRTDLLARIELARCATRVTSLVFEDCAAYATLAQDAAALERAYADYLAGKAQPKDAALLPEQHRAVAAASASAPDWKGVADPLVRLVAAGVLMQTNRADPATIAVTIDIALAQGWRRLGGVNYPGGPATIILAGGRYRHSGLRPRGMWWKPRGFAGGLRWRVRVRQSCLES